MRSLRLLRIIDLIAVGNKRPLSGVRFIGRPNSLLKTMVVQSETVRACQSAMKTELVPNEKRLGEICKALKSGGVVALPTDTIYGVAALAQNTKAIKKIYGIKRRDSQKPVAICVGNSEDVGRWCDVTITNELLHQLFPGPVTLLFKRSKLLNRYLNPEVNLVGVRIPDHQFIQSLCQTLGEPIALTSANVSNNPSALKPNEFKEIHYLLDDIYDDGPLGYTEQQRLGSTVVDLSCQGYYKIIRPGCAYHETVQKLHSYGLLKKQDVDVEN